VLDFLDLIKEVHLHVLKNQNPTSNHKTSTLVCNLPDLIKDASDPDPRKLRHAVEGIRALLKQFPSTPFRLSLHPSSITKHTSPHPRHFRPLLETWTISVNPNLQSTAVFPLLHAACLILTRIAMIQKQDPGIFLLMPSYCLATYIMAMHRALGTRGALELMGHSFCASSSSLLTEYLKAKRVLCGGEVLMRTSLDEALLDVSRLMLAPSGDSGQDVPSKNPAPVTPQNTVYKAESTPLSSNGPRVSQAEQGQAFDELMRHMRGGLIPSQNPASWANPELQARFHRVLRCSSSLWRLRASLCLSNGQVKKIKTGDQDYGVYEYVVPITSWKQHLWNPLQLLAAALATTQLHCRCAGADPAKQQLQHCSLVLQYACAGWRLKEKGVVATGAQDVLNGRQPASHLARHVEEEEGVQPASHCSCKPKLLR
jgi:hypothetical protein